jgi:hypothetical protein
MYVDEAWSPGSREAAKTGLMLSCDISSEERTQSEGTIETILQSISIHVFKLELFSLLRDGGQTKKVGISVADFSKT